MFHESRTWTDLSLPNSRDGASDLGPDQLDRLLDRVRAVFEVQAAVFALIDDHFFRASVEPDALRPLSQRQVAFCRDAIAGGRPFAATMSAPGGDPRQLRFLAGAPIAPASDRPRGALLLLDSRALVLSPQQSEMLADYAEHAAEMLARRRDALLIGKLRRSVEANAAALQRRSHVLERRPDMVAGALDAARAGMWECRLRDETLNWTNGVYDMFDLPRGSSPKRQATLELYTDASRAALETVRRKAIETRGSFTLDAEIVSALGRRRWIRLAGKVACAGGVPIRIFGLKQDVTEEKDCAERARRLSEIDPMTGLANRRLFDSAIGDLSGRGGLGWLLLVDLDGFKHINDAFGHALGDACLKEAASRLERSCRHAALVARIGGDEFAILAASDMDRTRAERLAGDIVEQLRIPVERDGRRFQLGGSVGMARADGCTPGELFSRADAALYAAKSAGRGVYRTFDDAMATFGDQDALRTSARAQASA